MQFTIDSAQRNYLLRTNLINNPKKEENPVSYPFVNRDITLMDKSAAFLAGASISGIVNGVKQVNSKFFLESLGKTKTLPSFDEIKQISGKMVETMHNKGKPVKVLFVEDTPKDMEKVSEIIAKNTLVGFRKTFNIGEKGLIAKGIKFFADRNAALISKGKKASFFINEKVAITSKSTHQIIFHEIGHAHVAESKLLKPLLTVGKKLELIFYVAGFFALAHTPKPPKQNYAKTRWEKTQDFMDEHIGTITFMTSVPLLAEKMIASRKSLQQAEKYLDKPKIKSLKKLYRIGLLTYLSSAVATAAGIGIGNKVQNNIIKQKQNPQDVYNLLI